MATLDTCSNIRLAVGHLAKVITEYIENPTVLQNNNVKIQLVKVACEFLTEEKLVIKEYLVKELCLKYRSDTVAEMKRNKMLTSLLPQYLLEEKNATADLFHILGKQYAVVKSCLIQCLMHSKYDEMDNVLINNRDINSVKEIMCAFYSLKYLHSDIQISDENLEKLSELLDGKVMI